MRRVLAAVLLVAGLLSGVAMAGEREIDALKAVLAAGPLDHGLFSAGFLAMVPPAQLDAVVGEITAKIGPVTAVTPKGGPDYLVETATHEMASQITLDSDGRIAGLLFRPAVARAHSIADILAEMAALAPQAAYLVTENGEPLHAHNADLALAVGSAFKLGVLKALKDEIDAGTRRWSDVVELTAADLSLPSGTLQTWPVGAPLTLHSAAAMMISISDNTATDLLMHALGRDAVEAALGVAPALTTRELFTLKANPDMLARYRAADLDGKRAVLEALAALPLPEAGAVGRPHDAGAEWYLTPTKLCTLIGAVAELGVTGINPGVADRKDWAGVAYKGGSEIGVLNLTTLATAQDGTRYCVSASWNDGKAIDETKATAAYASLLNRLARR